MSENKLTFEQAYQKLEKIAEQLNSNDISLDESIKLYEEGIKLSNFCTQALKNAKQKIETLKNGN